MLNRELYMQKLMQWKERKVIKVVTGVRRCGKSTLLQLFSEALQKQGTSPEACISINFENILFEGLKEYHKLHDYIVDKLQPNEMNYIFLDEIQLVPEFEKALDSLFLRDNVDIYITGSNAYLLSSELATLLSGRYVEISMLPFSFKEYHQLVGGDKRVAFSNYYKLGGFPYAATLNDATIYREYIQGIYSTVLLKDIVERKKIADVGLLEAIIRFMFDNIGNLVSVKKIADTLTSGGRKTTAATVSTYITALKDAFILYEANRYDVKGKQYLQSLEKYYLVDISFRTLLLSDRSMDIGHVLENIVYLELIRRGYKVFIGKVGSLEIDFIAYKGEERLYYQVSTSILDSNTREREFAPLRAIKDNYPKFVLSLDDLPLSENGILQQNIIDFLLE